MQEVLIGAALFTGVVLVLALLIMAARARLVPSGTVTVNVNGERNLTVPVGGKLLNLLADEGILLPSACGGGATCGQCTLMVLEGGGAQIVDVVVASLGARCELRSASLSRAPT